MRNEYLSQVTAAVRREPVLTILVVVGILASIALCVIYYIAGPQANENELPCTNPGFVLTQDPANPNAMKCVLEKELNNSGPELHVHRYTVDPDQELMNIKADINGIPSSYDYLYYMYASHNGGYYIVAVQPFDAKSLAHSSSFSMSWPTVPVRNGTTLTLVLATVDAARAITANPADDNGNAYVPALPPGTMVVQSDRTLNVPVSPKPNVQYP